MRDVMHRRRLLGCACGCAAAIATGMGFGLAAKAAPGPHTGLSAADALKILHDGNRDFVTESAVTAANGRQRRLEIAKGQTPFACLVSCSDSRVSPEILFGRGLGELFIVRNAGNTVDTAALGSIEYGVAELGIPLVLVLGHQRCGAVGAAIEVVQKGTEFPGEIGRMVEPIVPAVLAAQKMPGNLFDNAVRENVARIAHRLRTGSDPILIDPLKAGKLKIVGATYSLDDGNVDFFDLG